VAASAAAILALLPGALLGSASPAAAAATGGTDSPRAAQPLDGDGQCTFPAPNVKQTPWSLQRVLLNQLWQYTKGKNVKVAVIDSGVDIRNPQLAKAVDVGLSKDLVDAKGHGTTDPVGHGTEVAGIIAARPSKSTGFVGLAPEATIVSIRQASEDGTGTITNLVSALNAAVSAGAKVINISQDTDRGTPQLATAVHDAITKHDVVIVASAGNDGADGKARTTFPGGYPGVLAVGASDRNNERASFSQSGDFVGVAAPGVDMLSTVPGGGQCVDNGTSFAAPFVAGVAALIRAKHPDWKAHQVVAQIEQTATRTSRGHNALVGWGVVDPVRALTDDDKPIDTPTPDSSVLKGQDRVIPAALTFGDTAAQRRKRTAAYVVSGMAVALLAITGATVALRDRRRRS
jgi:type VII secretion-associated serine protease mycosin